MTYFHFPIYQCLAVYTFCGRNIQTVEQKLLLKRVCMCACARLLAVTMGECMCVHTDLNQHAPWREYYMHELSTNMFSNLILFEFGDILKAWVIRRVIF
jgi:hypothetical protein